MTNRIPIFSNKRSASNRTCRAKPTAWGLFFFYNFTH